MATNDKKVVVKSADMAEEMQQDVIELSSQGTKISADLVTSKSIG